MTDLESALRSLQGIYAHYKARNIVPLREPDRSNYLKWIRKQNHVMEKALEAYHLRQNGLTFKKISDLIGGSATRANRLVSQGHYYYRVLAFTPAYERS